MTTGDTVNLDPLWHDWAIAATPPPKVTVSEWADANRILPEASGARGGRWRTAATPYLRGIMDAPLEPGVQKIAVRKSAQVGGSEALNNILAYFIEYDPCPMLLVHPSDKVAQEFSKERLADMLRSTPALARVVSDKRRGREDRKAHEGESTLDLKLFPGGYLALGGANTPNTFARRAVRIAIGDDVDRFPAVVGEEGDPADLLSNRTRTFHDGLLIMVSTPTLKGGRIDTLFERSDQRQYMVTCPDCGHQDWITWSNPKHFRVTFEERDPSTARLACPECGAMHDEPARRAMVDAGVWRPSAEPKEEGLVGFHLPAMVTTLGNASLSTWVGEWLSAREKGKESTRVFINTTLAEGWEDRTAKMDPQLLLHRRKSYGEGVEVPGWAPLLTAGVDVQLDRFELQVIAWGAAGERAVVDVRSIPGDPKRSDTQDALLEALGRRYVHETGHQLPIHGTCIDTGYATEEMYDFVLRHQVRRIFATKGYAGRSGEPIVGKPSEKRYGRKPRPVRLFPVNVDDAKADIMAALALVEPGPGYIHFPEHDQVHEEYFAQLCAEHRETRHNKQGVATHSVWVQDRQRNEALDTAVLCLAACRLLNPNIRQLLEVLDRTPVERPGEPSRPPANAHPDQQTSTGSTVTQRPRRRVGRSSYLGR